MDYLDQKMYLCKLDAPFYSPDHSLGITLYLLYQSAVGRRIEDLIVEKKTCPWSQIALRVALVISESAHNCGTLAILVFSTENWVSSVSQDF